jgi:hypothetical protein
MPDLFSPTDVPLLNILSRAGGALFKPKFEDKYGEDIKALDGIPDPDARMQKIAEVADRAMADGYSLPERKPLTTRTDQIIDEALKPGTSDAIMRAARYTQMMGRVPQAGNSMGGLNTMAEILQRGSVANYNAGPRTTQALTAAGRNVEQAGQAKAGATRNFAQAGLAGTRAADIQATQPGRMALTGEQTDKANAEAQRALQPREQKPFIKTFIENGQNVYKLIDNQGNVVDIPGNAALSQNDLMTQLLSSLQGGAPKPQSPAPAAAPTVAAPATAQGLGQSVQGQPTAQPQAAQLYRDPQGNLHRRTDPNAQPPPDWVPVN